MSPGAVRHRPNLVTPLCRPYVNMADVAEDQVIAACSTLLVVASLGAATIESKKTKELNMGKPYIRE